MFIGYSYSQWLEVIRYMIFVFVLFAGIYFASVKATYFLFEEKENVNKLKRIKSERMKKTSKKKYFIDVA